MASITPTRFLSSSTAGHTFFFEDYSHATQKGIISFVEVQADGSVSPVRPVLEESWHLSYPFLLQIGRDIFLVPKSSGARDVAVYRADPFPHRWVRHGTLLSDIDLSDATIVEHNAKLWMFGTTRDGAGSPSDTLSIFSAEPGRRFHTLARAGNLECIDGSATEPKSRMVSRLLAKKWWGLPSIGAPAQVRSQSGSIGPPHLACED